MKLCNICESNKPDVTLEYIRDGRKQIESVCNDCLPEYLNEFDDVKVTPYEED